jgi:coenzyme F420-reducing hydrogenase alpha subunit
VQYKRNSLSALFKHYYSVHYNSVNGGYMKNITLSANERMIRLAREKAYKNKKTLNALFREWLTRYVKNESYASNYSNIMQKLKYVNAGKHFNRDELNER